MHEDIITLANAADCNSYEALREQYPLPPAQLDGRVYTDPTLYAAERKRIFLESWFPACPQSDIPNPGDYTTWERLGQSVIIIRQEDGTISAWHNVCLHRGAKLVAGSGCAKGGLITCPWHGFSYSTAGELTRIPLADTFDSSAIANRRCQAVRMESWGGYCWLTFSDSQKPLTQYLGGLYDELSYYKLDTWKEARIRIDSPHSWMTLPVEKFTERAGAQASHQDANVCHYTVFPNTIFSCFPTHLQMWSVYPVAINRTVLDAWGIVGTAPAGIEEDDWQAQNARSWQHFLDVASEDIGILNSLDDVVRSEGYKGSMFNTAESRLTAFHQEILSRCSFEGFSSTVQS
jgi:phenylpropionate dioxygenase-like ring-hydroxylating dioxygenase large terminal subunit